MIFIDAGIAVMTRRSAYPLLILALVILLFSHGISEISAAQESHDAKISGFVLDHNNKPLHKAAVAIFGPYGFKRNLLTDRYGRFTVHVTREGWYGVYVGYDNPDTPGIDYVPAVWWAYIEPGSEVSHTFVLERGATIYVEGDIWLVEKNRPASYFKFTVVKPDGSPLPGRSLRVYGSGGDLSKRFHFDPRIVVVPAETRIAIKVFATADHLSREFMLRGEGGYFKVSQGEILHVDVREDNLKFNIKIVRSKIDSALNLLKDAEDAGFLVTHERNDLMRAYDLIDSATLSLKRRSYDEAFAKLRNAYTIITDSTNRLQGLLQIGFQSALILPLLFVFISSASAYLITDRYRGYRVVMREKNLFSFSLNPIIASLLYAAFISLFYAVFPGCRMVQWEIFIAIVVSAFIIGQLLIVASPRIMRESKGERRSIQLKSAIIVAFSMACRNLRRRRLRTILSLMNIIILIFGFIALTSVSPGYGLILRGLRPAHSVDAILIRDVPSDTSSTFIPLPEQFIEWLEENPNVTLISPKAENTPRSPLNPLGYLYTEDGDAIIVDGVIGIKPSIEANITHINDIVVIGNYLEDDDPFGILVSSRIHDEYKVNVGDKLYGFGKVFTVRGFFDPDALEKFPDLDSQTIVPFQIDLFSGEAIPCQSNNVIIIPYETALQLPDVYTSRVIIQLREHCDYRRFADMIAYMWEYRVYIAHPGRLEMLYLGEYIEMKGTGLIPFLMILVILNIGVSMMGSVNERRDEIGALLSVGLNPTHVACLFVAEALVIGLIGGGIGFLAGISGYRLLPAFMQGALQVREKVSAEWSLIALFLSGFTSVIAALVPALRASTMITPSLLRRWRLDMKMPAVDKHGWSLELPIKLRKRELEPFVGFIMMRLREGQVGLTWTISGLSLQENPEDKDALKRITFRVHIEKFGWSDNELIISRDERSGYYNVRMICKPHRRSQEAVFEIATHIRRIILEWEALTFEVATPYDPSLRQLYTLINIYTPTSLYVITSEPEIKDELNALQKRLEIEGIKPPKFIISHVDPLNVRECMKIAEDIVSRVDVVCISGEPSSISSSLAMSALKQKKMICYVIDPLPPEERMKRPFEVLKVVNL